MVISWQFNTRFTRTSNTLENKSVETIYYLACTTCICERLCAGKKVFMILSPLLEQSCNKYWQFWFALAIPCLLITPFHVSLSVPTCALKYPKRTIDSEFATLERTSFTSCTKEYSLVIHHLAARLEALVILLQDPCIFEEKLVLFSCKLSGSLRRK